MITDVGAATREGTVRRINEDGFLVSGLEGEEPRVNALWHHPAEGPMGLLAAVADGLGGAVSGELASREGLTAFAVGLFGHWGRLPAGKATEARLLRALRAAALGANAAVLDYGEEEPLVRGMTASLLGAVAWGRHVYLCQVGEARAYAYRHPHLMPLTGGHPGYLGSLKPLEPALLRFHPRRGDRILLATDGLYRPVGEAYLAALLARGQSLPWTAEALVEAAGCVHEADDATALLLGLDDLDLPLPQAGERVRLDPIPPGDRLGFVARIRKALAGG